VHQSAQFKHFQILRTILALSIPFSFLVSANKHFLPVMIVATPERFAFEEKGTDRFKNVDLFVGYGTPSFVVPKLYVVTAERPLTDSDWLFNKVFTIAAGNFSFSSRNFLPGSSHQS
jgi:hypothetical protein